MIPESRVNQFMQYYIIGKLLRQSEQSHIQVDVVGRAATAPSRFLVPYDRSIVLEAVFLCQLIESRGQNRPGFGPVYRRQALSAAVLLDSAKPVEMLPCPAALGRQKPAGNPNRNSQ